MNKTFNILLSVVGLTLFLGLLPSCGGGKPKSNYVNKASKYFAADESLSPIIDEELDIFHFRTHRDSIYPMYISEQEAMDKLMNQEVWLTFTTRQLTENEKTILKEKNYTPKVYALAYDALALIINKDNPDSLITVDQFVKILTGEITEWKQIYPESKLKNIRMTFDNPRSSAVRFCVDSILHGREFKTDGNVKAVQTSAEVVADVEKYPNSIGIVGSIWLNDQRDTTNLTYRRNIKVMRVSRAETATVANSYDPSQWNIAYNYYPFIRTIYSICIDPFTNSVPRAFANFCWLPEPGQRIFFNAGLFPARADYSVREVVVD